MKLFQSFLAFWLLPLLVFFPVILLQTNESVSDVLSNKITFFTIIYFAIISFSTFLITKYLKERGLVERKTIFYSSIICFALVFLFSISLHFPFYEKINLFPPFFQSLVAIAVFLIEYLLTRFYKTKNNIEFEFNKSKFYNFKLLLIVFFIDFVFIFLLTLDTYSNTNILGYFTHIKIFIPYLIGVIVLSFFGFWIFNKVQINSLIKILIISFSSFLILQVFNIVKYKFHLGLILNFFMISLFSTCLIYGFLYHHHHKKNIRKLKHQNIQNEAQYLELKNQINPHFLFNNLNTLISFIEDNPQKAIEFGHNLSNVYRHYLHNQTDEFINLKTELNFIKEYLEIYKAKFENGFTFITPNEVDSNTYILSFSIQEIIDNIFKHNCLDEDNPLIIRIFIEDDLLVISNFILPKKVDSSNNIGLDNINKRYELLVNRSIVVETIENVFVVKLPILDIES
jgi:sensor histidine kinase YesM